MSFDRAGMEGVNGVRLLTVVALMGLGLAIIFGLMGVINMAHGELMAMGAYTTYLTAVIFEHFAPTLLHFYLPVAVVLAFGVTFAFGFALERSFIRFLYHRPLDTILATWGLSLILQQAFRSLFGPREVGGPAPSWLTGAWQPVGGISLPLSRLFIIGLTVAVGR